MTHPQAPRRDSNAGRVILWIVTLLLVAIGSYFSYLAFRGNPYLSNEHHNGISKWRFLEECKDELRTQVSGQLAGAQISFAPPVQRVQGVTEVPDGGWNWQGFALVQASQGNRIPVQFACAHNKASGKTQILGIQPAQ